MALRQNAEVATIRSPDQADKSEVSRHTCGRGQRAPARRRTWGQVCWTIGQVGRTQLRIGRNLFLLSRLRGRSSNCACECRKVCPQDSCASFWLLRPWWVRASHHPRGKAILCTSLWSHKQSRQAKMHEHGDATWEAHHAITSPYAVALLWRSPHQCGRMHLKLVGFALIVCMAARESSKSPIGHMRVRAPCARSREETPSLPCAASWQGGGAQRRGGRSDYGGGSVGRNSDRNRQARVTAQAKRMKDWRPDGFAHSMCAIESGLPPHPNTQPATSTTWRQALVEPTPSVDAHPDSVSLCSLCVGCCFACVRRGPRPVEAAHHVGWRCETAPRPPTSASSGRYLGSAFVTGSADGEDLIELPLVRDIARLPCAWAVCHARNVRRKPLCVRPPTPAMSQVGQDPESMNIGKSTKHSQNISFWMRGGSTPKLGPKPGRLRRTSCKSVDE